MDSAQVSVCPIAAQPAFNGPSGYLGLYREAVLSDEHVGRGTGLGENYPI